MVLTRAYPTIALSQIVSGGRAKIKPRIPAQLREELEFREGFRGVGGAARLSRFRSAKEFSIRTQGKSTGHDSNRPLMTSGSISSCSSRLPPDISLMFPFMSYNWTISNKSILMHYRVGLGVQREVTKGAWRSKAQSRIVYVKIA